MRYILILFVFCSCYSPQKARKQFGRAVVTYPDIGADYCARTYPPKDSLIKGDTVLKFDTIYTGGETFFDTITLKGDTIRIVKTVQLPGRTIVEKYFIHDTVVKVNTADVDYWKIQANKAINIATDKTKESDKWKRIAKKRFWYIIGLGAVIALGVVGFISRKVKKKIPLKYK